MTTLTTTPGQEPSVSIPQSKPAGSHPEVEGFDHPYMRGWSGQDCSHEGGTTGAYYAIREGWYWLATWICVADFRERTGLPRISRSAHPSTRWPPTSLVGTQPSKWVLWVVAPGGCSIEVNNRDPKPSCLLVVRTSCSWNPRSPAASPPKGISCGPLSLLFH